MRPARRAGQRSPANGLLTSPILPTLLKLTLPNAIAMVGTTLVAVAETSYIGRLGIEPLAAIALVFPFVMLTQMMSAGAMGGGVSSAISRALGAGDRDRAATLALHAVMIGLLGGLFFTAVMLLFGRPFFMLLGGRGGVLEQALQYSQVLFSGAVSIWLVNTLASVLRGTGDMRLPSATLIGAAIVQIAVGGALGLGLAGLPQLGMRGVAAGQLIAFSLGAIFLGMDPRQRPQPADAGFPRLHISARHVPRYPEGRRDLLRGAAAERADHPDLHQDPGRLRHRDAGRLRHGLAARIPADPDFVRLRRGLGADGRHGHRRRHGGARPQGGVDRGRRIRPDRRTDRPDRRGPSGAVGVMFTSDPGVTAAAYSYFALAGPAFAFFGLGTCLYFASQGAAKVGGPVLAGTARLLLVGLGGWWLVSIDAPAWTLFALVGAAMVLFGLGVAASVWLTRWGK